METLVKPRAGSRRKVHQDKTPKEVTGSNGIDAESFLVWVGKIRQEDALFQMAKKRRDKVRKLAKNAGVQMAELDRALKDADKDPDIVLRSLSTYQQYSAWLDAPGRQMTLFEIPNSALLSHEERQQKADRSGYTLGLMGRNPDTEAYPVDHEFHQLHMEGWHRGQKIHLDRIQPIEIAIESADKPEPEPEPEKQEERELEEA